ncbi:MAG: AAA family ATPase [Chloroflexi bacterium]|nr:AAA family ATPase [Chloroflexota bacterium]
MKKDLQLKMPLFDLTPRNVGKRPIDLSQGGLADLEVHNFKGIDSLRVEFDPVTLLIGANNCGKSTLLQAIRLFYYCIDRCGDRNSSGKMFLKKQVMPFSDFTLIPAHNVKQLVTNGVTPSSRKLGIYISGKLRSGLSFDFTIYSAYSTLLVILPGQLCPRKMTKDEFDFASRQPLYVPGFFGVVTKELLSTNRRLEESLGSGHHNEVLRNLILRLQLQKPDMDFLTKILSDEFGVRFQGVPGNPNDVEFLQAAYREGDLRVPLDLVSAGSGFLQVLQILTHALQSPSPILLLDEPDAHMHTLLQQHFIALLRTFANERKMQVIMASHSETFIRTMDLSEFRLIDRTANRSESFSDPLVMKSELASHGVWPDEVRLAEALRIKRVLLCESSPDHDLLCAFGKNCNSNWGQIKKQYEVIQTEGANDNIVARVEAIVDILNKLLNGGVNIAYLRDRDLMCDEREEASSMASREKGLNLIVTQRRNRECYLVEPSVVEAAVLSQGDKVPKEWTTEGYVSGLVKEWCLEYCCGQLDDLPHKVNDYNESWLRSNFEDEERNKARTRLTTFIRTNWSEKISSGEIPWKLMDGRGALKFIRGKLQEKSLMLPDALLLEHIGAAPVPDDFANLISIIVGWTELPESEKVKSGK